MLHTQVIMKAIAISFLSLFVVLFLSSINANAKPERRGPPSEAIDACANKTEKEACTFISHKGHNIEGNCIVPPRNEAVLVCAPDGGPPHHRPSKKPKE